jgi:hydroxyethylthiazole kinase
MKNCMSQVRSIAPLIHNITNYVTVTDVANVLLACGASPIMSDAVEEVEEITSICAGLNINIGTLNHNTIKAMFLAGKRANALGHKVLLDPVGAGASRLRTETSLRLLEKLKLDVIRGNISEIKTLALGNGKTKGVDADASESVTEENLERSIQFAKSFAIETGSIIVITGAIDLVAGADRCYVIRNGRPEMGQITGTGCQLSALITAFLSANPERLLDAAAAAVCAMGLAGEIGWSNMEASDGNSTYRNRIIDAIHQMNGDTLAEGARYEIR